MRMITGGWKLRNDKHDPHIACMELEAFHCWLSILSFCLSSFFFFSFPSCSASIVAYSIVFRKSWLGMGVYRYIDTGAIAHNIGTSTSGIYEQRNLSTSLLLSRVAQERFSVLFPRNTFDRFGEFVICVRYIDLRLGTAHFVKDLLFKSYCHRASYAVMKGQRARGRLRTVDIVWSPELWSPFGFSR